MLPKSLRVVHRWQGGDVVPVRLQRAVLRNVVRGQRGERVVLHRQHVLAVELVEVGVQDPPVELVGDTASIVGFRDEVLEGVPWGLDILVQVGLQQIVRDLEVRIVEVVRNVQTQGSELPPLKKKELLEIGVLLQNYLKVTEKKLRV